MHIRLIAVACATALALPISATAADNHRAYGRLHLSVDRLDDSGYVVSGDSNKGNHIGMKGSMDTNISDFKVVYKIEAGMILNDGGTDTTVPAGTKEAAPAGLTQQRDSWIGMSSERFGTFRLGTVSTPYKSSGKMVDPLFYTSAEGRGVLKTMSAHHSGTGDDQGRSTNTVRYDSRSFNGVKAVGHYNLAPGDNNMGLGLHYKTDDVVFFIDYLNSGAKDETAMKIGSKVKAGAASFAFQYEIDDSGSVAVSEGAGDQLFLAATYEMDATALVLTLGNNDNETGYSFGTMHKLNKNAKGYLLYANDGSSDFDTSLFTAGMMVSF